MRADFDKEFIYRIWQSLREHGKYKDITISNAIRESWERSKIYGVDPTKPYCDVVLNAAELAERRANNCNLVEQASTMMEHLHEFTEGSGFLYTLTDREGYCLISIGDKDAVDFTAVAKLTEGANWSEEVMGTNSNSLAMVLRKPVQIFGYEHYCRVATGATCSAAPIFDEDDNIIGVFNIAGPYHLVNRHTLGMAVATARNIERQLALYHVYQQSEMANLHKTTIMNSMSDGVLTLDCESRITHLNVLAAQSLGIDYYNAIGQKLSELMFPNNELFLSKILNYKTMSGENLVVKRKNDMIKLAVNCTPLTGKNNQILGTVVILSPMQKYKRLIQRVAGARNNITFDQIIGRSSKFKDAIKYAQLAVESDSNVLLLGESGVGKEMFAQAIHNASNRSQELFLAINCAALPRELISSELFGYEDGAFTGARKGGNPGKFELADQGTMFLDEIGEMPLDMQASLLRVLENGTIERLGGRELIPVNVRIIAATNKKLLDEVKKGNFRLDLYYRLGVMIINIPPLRERAGDVPELVEHFIKTIGPRHGKNIIGIDNRAMDILINYDWPGNVRELNNVIERAINICTGNVLTADMLPPEMYEDTQEYMRIWEDHPSIDIMEEQLIRNYLNKFSNNRSKVAKELGISRSSLYRKMAKFSIY
jgi:transcriptional regulator with PAS, ATPase and Fis domain